MRVCAAKIVVEREKQHGCSSYYKGGGTTTIITPEAFSQAFMRVRTRGGGRDGGRVDFYVPS